MGRISEESIGNDILFFNTFLECGFENWFSYYSIIIHERYLFKDKSGDVICYCWRNADSYKFEFREFKRL